MKQENDYIKSMEREQLEDIARNILTLNCFHFIDMAGNDCGAITTNADNDVIQKLYRNLRELNRGVSLKELLEELESRNFYAQFYPLQTVQLMHVNNF